MNKRRPSQAMMTRKSQLLPSSSKGTKKEEGKGAYGVATIRRLLKITGLFGEYMSLLQCSFAKETYILRSLLIVATPYPRTPSYETAFISVFPVVILTFDFCSWMNRVYPRTLSREIWGGFG